MTWREELKPASFRGIGFLVDSHGIDFGRRNHLHEYPLRDKPYSQDLGKMAKTFSVRAYLLGDEYTANRNDLMAAIEDNPNPGTLILPLYPSLRVKPGSCRVDFDNRNGGQEFLSLEFTIAGDNTYPNQNNATGSKVIADVASGREALNSVFSSVFNAASRPEYLRTDAIDTSNTITDLATSLLGTYSPNADGLQNITSAIAAVANNAGSLVGNGSQWANGIVSIVTAIRDGFDTPDQAYKMNSDLLAAGNDLQPVIETTTTRTIQKNNRAAQLSLVKRHALFAMAENATVIDYESYDQAVATRNTLASQIDDEIIAAGLDEDDAINAMEKARASVVIDITARSGSLQRITFLNRPQQITALALSYDLYDTTDREADLIARNKLIRPHAIPAGSQVEVLL